MTRGAAVSTEFVQNTPAWVDARRSVIGSSDIPILTGNSPYKTSALELWAYKTRRPDGTFLLDPEPPDDETQELFDLGHALEPVIAERCALVHGDVMRVPRMVTHPDIPWAAASLDRRRAPRTIVEVKWVPNRSWHGGPEPVPAYVQDQVQWQLFVKGWERGHVAVLHGSHVACHDLEADRTYQDNLLTIAADFRDNHVVPGVMPPIDGSDATRRTLVRMYPRDTLGLAEPTAEIAALVRDEHEAGKRKDAAEGEYERIRNVLRAVLNDHAGAEDQDWRVTFRKNADSVKTVVNHEAIARAYRVLLDALGDPEKYNQLSWEEKRIAGSLSVDELDAIEAIHTSRVVKEGARPLVVKVREAGKWV